ncbi:MAG TPA: hypothetical protein DCY55_01335, partial [Gammaproteobacteria bacterium]|nr:hypothetical protein [Gammaproteobacteria bacterium]
MGYRKFFAVVRLLAILASAVLLTNGQVQAQTGTSYSFDPTWPKDLPNNWKMGGVTGLAVDSND